MLPFVWASDTHLDHCSDTAADAFYRKVQVHDHLVVTGDISSARRLMEHLEALVDCGVRLSFVLGNHDYYGSEVFAVRRVVAAWAAPIPNVDYLDDCAPVDLGNGDWLVGVDGYSDGRAPDLMTSKVWLNDYIVCRTFEDVTPSNRTKLRDILNRLGDESAQRLHAKLQGLFQTTPRAAPPARIFIATHAPPWTAAHWYDGKLGDRNWQPHFTNLALGEAILEWSPRYPTTQFVVLAGHTHGPVNVEIASNVRCLVAGATYGRPALQDIAKLPTPGANYDL